MSHVLLPELNDSERLIGTDTLEAFLDVPGRCWTHCSGMKRPYIWQFAKRRAYRKLVKMNKDIMLDMLARGDFEDCFVFSKNVGLVHRIKHRPDFGALVVEELPFRRFIYMGNSCLRGGMINRGGVCDPEFGV